MKYLKLPEKWSIHDDKITFRFNIHCDSGYWHTNNVEYQYEGQNVTDLLYSRLENEYNQHQIDRLKNEIRLKRDSLLKETDYLMMSDYPISDVDKEKVKEYRQKLRDIPSQTEFPKNVIWPEKPEDEDNNGKERN